MPFSDLFDDLSLDYSVLSGIFRAGIFMPPLEGLDCSYDSCCLGCSFSPFRFRAGITTFLPLSRDSLAMSKDILPLSNDD